MDSFGPDYQQILSLASPPLEMLAGKENAPELARIANDGMAEICAKYPDRFPGFIAAAAVQDTDALVEESERAVRKLGAVGVQVFTNAGGRPMDGPEYRPFYKLMSDMDRMIWVHPSRSARFADYQSEDRSHYEIWWAFGWPYETSVFMARLVFTKTFDELPNLKIITHHGGGMIPFFEGRVGPGLDQLGNRTSGSNYKELLKEMKKRPIDYFRMFYADTATFGGVRAQLLRCGPHAVRVRCAVRSGAGADVYPRHDQGDRRARHLRGRSREALSRQCKRAVEAEKLNEGEAA
jgi:predicted TIM-barrel fold metal-dependent hydrolase